MTGIDILLLFLVVIPITIVLIAVALIRHNLVRQAQLQAQNILNQQNVECLNCGNEQMTWGVVSSQSFVQFLPFAGVRPVRPLLSIAATIAATSCFLLKRLKW